MIVGQLIELLREYPAYEHVYMPTSNGADDVERIEEHQEHGAPYLVIRARTEEQR